MLNRSSYALPALFLAVLACEGDPSVLGPEYDFVEETRHSVDLDELESIVDGLDDTSSDCAAIVSGLNQFIEQQRASQAIRFTENTTGLGEAWFGAGGHPGHAPDYINIDSCVWNDDCEESWVYDPPGPDGPFNPGAAYVLAHEGAHLFLHDHDDESTHSRALACLGPEI